jgi:hypothetical protein
VKPLLILVGALLLTCAEPITYECDGWEKRQCTCPDGQEGMQRCSRGQHFGDPINPRTWQYCSCCFIKKEDKYGVYRYETDPDSGCWEDAYDPAASDAGGDE